MPNISCPQTVMSKDEGLAVPGNTEVIHTKYHISEKHGISLSTHNLKLFKIKKHLLLTRQFTMRRLL